MALYGPSTATASVTVNTNAIAITGMDLSVVDAGMTINLGARDQLVGPAYLIASVTRNGQAGGTITTLASIPTGYSNVAFVIDTRAYQGSEKSYAAEVNLQVLAAIQTLFGVSTNLYSGSRQLYLDKSASTALSRVGFATAGRAWGDIAHRSFPFTPTGGQAASIETLAVRAFSDGTTPTDALIIDLTNGTGDLRAGSSTMVAASTVDLGSAPTKKVAISGGGTINSLGPGRHLERLVHIVDGGGTLTHNATSLILPGRANIVMAAGDWFHATSDGAGNWRVGSYQRASGQQIGFAPVEQGGGAGQGTNKIRIGYSMADAAPKLQVDATDFGKIWTDFSAGKVLAPTGYQRLPSGLILQWGTLNQAASDYAVAFPIAFPAICVGVFAASNFNPGASNAFATNVDGISLSFFNMRCRYIGGGSVAPSQNLPVSWFAVGY